MRKSASSSNANFLKIPHPTHLDSSAGSVIVCSINMRTTCSRKSSFLHFVSGAISWIAPAADILFLISGLLRSAMIGRMCFSRRAASSGSEGGLTVLDNGFPGPSARPLRLDLVMARRYSEAVKVESANLLWNFNLFRQTWWGSEVGIRYRSPSRPPIKWAAFLETFEASSISALIHPINIALKSTNMSSTTTLTITEPITAQNILRLFPDIDTSSAALDGHDAEQIRLMDEVCIVLDENDKPIGNFSKKICTCTLRIWILKVWVLTTAQAI